MSTSLESLGIQNITSYVVQTELNLPNADSGGTANVYRGTYTRTKDYSVIEVAIKVVRTGRHGGELGKLTQLSEKNLIRELTIWAALTRIPHENVLQLLGVVDSPLNQYLASVSECCRCSLEVYFEDRPEKTQYVKFMREILQGLVHMHGLSPPIVHGDLKFQNILISQEGDLKLCDFGQSQFTSDETILVPNASGTFHATYRYMSPELFQNKQRVRPTMFSDVWAYGCVALQLLSGLLPYHTIKSDIVLLHSIVKGVLPSIKPERPYAPRCLNEHLWNIVRPCWNPVKYRPTSSYLLSELNRLLQLKLIDSLPTTPDRMSIDFDDQLPDWPQDMIELGHEENTRRNLKSFTSRADIYMYHDGSGRHGRTTLSLSARSLQEPSNDPEKAGALTYIIKVPKPTNLSGSERDPFLRLLREIVRERYSLQHENIVEMIGIDTTFQPYPGLVFEHCEKSSLDQYGLNLPLNRHTNTRLMINLLSGLQYLHTFPTPIAHGDLNPSNILVDAAGTLKISLFSLSGLMASMPNFQEQDSMKERIGSARYLSPEMLDKHSQPSPAADMWALGCIVFWLFSRFTPYHNVHDESELQIRILQGVLPYSARSLLPRNDASRKHAWLTDGVSDWAEKCWRGTDRPSASGFLKFVKGLPADMDSGNNAWLSGVTNLTGSFSNSTIVPIGGTEGTWRRSSTFKESQNTIYVIFFSGRTSFRRGLFRILTEVTIKWSSPRKSVATLAARESIRHELRILAQVKHPNICALWGYEKGIIGSTDVPAIVTECGVSGTLKEYLANHGTELDMLKKIKLMENILKAVEYLHDGVTQGTVVHGNIDTTSVVVDKHGIPKLQNFEFAHQYMRSDQPALVSMPIYTASLAPQPSRWHPPEMFAPTGDWPLVTRHADLWAAGCLLLGIISGQEPYSGTNVPAVFTRITANEAPYSRGACPSRGIWEIAERLWATNPLDRISATRALQLIKLDV